MLTLTSRSRPCSNFKIPLAVPSHASIVRRALQVDKERHPHEVQVSMEDLPSGLSMYVSPPFLLSPCLERLIALRRRWVVAERSRRRRCVCSE